MKLSDLTGTTISSVASDVTGSVLVLSNGRRITCLGGLFYNGQKLNDDVKEAADIDMTDEDSDQNASPFVSDE